MSTLSFDISTYTGDSADARITLTEFGNSTIQVNVEVINGTIADLRGFFFNISDESLVSGLSVSGADVTDSQFKKNKVSNLGGGVNMNGTHTDFDGGVEIGTSGIGKDDISETTFILFHDSVDLTLDLFENQDFGVRLTSVGENREGSSKLVGISDLAPNAEPDTVNTEEDTPVTIPVLNNDDQGDGPATVSVEPNDGPANGIVTVNPDGTVEYTPNPDFFGEDTFTYTITDADGDTSTATVTVIVDPNPDAVNDVATTDEDVPLIIDVLANDDIAGEPNTTVTGVSSPSNGNVVINPDGTVTYTPDLNFNGTDSFEYTITDDDGDTSTATVTITVMAVNDPPVAIDDTDTVAEGGTTTTNVLGNDSDPDNANSELTVTIDSNPSNGTVTLNPNGTITYTHDGSETTSDSYTYTITDPDGLTDTATVTLGVTPVNDPPVAVDDSDTVAEGESTTTNVLGNDSDPDNTNSELTVTIDSNPTNGTVLVNGDGTITYTHDGSETTSDSYTYTITDPDGQSDTATVTLGVTAVNDPPVANNDSFFVELGDMALVNVPANDTDVDGTVNPSTLVFGSPNLGTAVEDGGQLKYTATPAGFSYPDSIDGTDSSAEDDFTYTVKDDLGATSNPATVTAKVIDPLRETATDSSESSNGQLITLGLETEDRTFNDWSFAEVNINFGSLTPTDINISFVVDESGSISSSQYTQQLLAIQNTINQLRTDFTGSGTDIQVQIVGFSDNATQATYDLNDSTLDDVTTGTPISSQQGGFTNYEAGLSLGEDFFTTGQGATDENFLVFLSDGEPNRPSGNPVGAYQDELTGLNNANVDIIAIGFGTGITKATLDAIDNTGAGADVVPTAADLGDILGASPLFPANLLSFSLTVNGTEVADETDLTQLPGGDYELNTTLNGLDNSLGAINTIIAMATFDVDKDGSFNPMIDATRTATTVINGTDGSNILFA